MKALVLIILTDVLYGTFNGKKNISEKRKKERNRAISICLSQYSLVTKSRPKNKIIN